MAKLEKMLGSDAGSLMVIDGNGVDRFSIREPIHNNKRRSVSC